MGLGKTFLFYVSYMGDWVFYIIKNGHATYAGVSPDPVRRLRQHNGELKGGAKYTTGRGPGWKHVCLVKGFQDKIQALQFEWAVKHVLPRNAGGIDNRLQKLNTVLCRQQWTSKSPLASTVPLTLEWCSEEHIIVMDLPSYVSCS